MKNAFLLSITYILLLTPPSQGASDLEILPEPSTHIIPRREDPYCDLRLHPRKGITLWKEERDVSYTFFYFGKKHTIVCPEYVEITFSYPSLPFDILSITQGVHPYTFRVGGEMLKQRMIAAARLDFYAKPFFTIQGEQDQGNLHLSFDVQKAEKNLYVFIHLLNEVEDNAIKNKLHMIYVHFPFTFMPDLEPAHVIILRESKYLYLGTIKDLNTRQDTVIYYKKGEDCLVSDQETDTRFYSSTQWTEPLPQAYPIFGAFLRDERGSIIGGITGTFHPQASVPFGKLTSVWLHPDHENRRDRKKLLKCGEMALRAYGLRVAEISFAPPQLHNFYEERGYSHVLTYPQYIERRGGMKQDSEILRKALYFNYTFSSSH